MAIHTVIRMGDPRLVTVSEPFDMNRTGELRQLGEDMLETMKLYGGVGLAAPQIGILSRVIVFGFDASERYPDAPAVPQTVLVNPVVRVMDHRLESAYEGCLSIPGIRGPVPRYLAIHYRGFDAEGGIVDRQAEGFHARVVQHELDHLNGILYPMRMTDLSQLGFEDELTAQQ